MLDLHGMTLHNAWKEFQDEVDRAYFNKKRSVTIVTGRGPMQREFPSWVSGHPRALWCEEQNPGCFRVKIRKQ